MIRTENIVSLSEFRQNATAHLDRLAESGAIEVLTVNGQAKGVVMSPKAFDELAAWADRARIAEAIRAGLEDVRAGRVKDSKTAMRDIAAATGLRFDR